MVLEFGAGLSAGIGRAVSEIDRMLNLAMACLIGLEVLFTLLTLIIRTKGIRVFLGIYSTLMLAPVIFSFQHEVQAYFSGTLLLCALLCGWFTVIFARR